MRTSRPNQWAGKLLKKRTATLSRAGHEPAHSSWRWLLIVGVSLTTAGCSLVTTPRNPVLSGPSFAPPGEIAYAVCPSAVTPVELSTGTAEANIPLPVTGTPGIGAASIATSPGGHWAYVVTTEGVPPGSHPISSVPVTTGVTPQPSGSSGQNVVIPVNLVTQQAGRPIDLPGSGPTHGIVVLPGGHTAIAASGTSVVPIDLTRDRVGTPLNLGTGHTIFGMALNPAGTSLYVLVAGGVIPVNTVAATAGAPIVTGLSVSSVYSPHGIVVSPDGTTVYVIGQGGTDYGGRVLPITAATGALQPEASFDRFGIADPAAVAITPDGSTLYVVDAADNWINPLPIASFASPPAPIRLPVQSGGPAGTQHPSDIVLAPGGATAYLIDGFADLVPFTVATHSFGQPIPVCSGASSMAIAPAP